MAEKAKKANEWRVVSFKFPAWLIDLLDAEAKRKRVSRNRLAMEIILMYFTKQLQSQLMQLVCKCQEPQQTSHA